MPHFSAEIRIASHALTGSSRWSFSGNVFGISSQALSWYSGGDFAAAVVIVAAAGRWSHFRGDGGGGIPTVVVA